MQVQKPIPPIRSVAVLAFDGISDFHLSVPGLVFGEDRRDLGIPRFKVSFCASSAGLIRTSAGLEVHIRRGLSCLTKADIVIIPSWDLAAKPADAKLLSALRRAHRRGAVLVGLCLGAFLLAEAGLLSHRRATTHWRWADVFAQRYPEVLLDPHVLYVDDGNILSSAGTVAGLDCCLHLMRRLAGTEAVIRLARVLVTPPHRQGNQAQYIERPLIRKGSDMRLAATLDWAAAHFHQRLDVGTLAAHAAMSRRSFTRHFREVTGASLVQWLTSQRLTQVQRYLETTPMSIEVIAEKSGFGSALSLRQQFIQRFGTSPSQYRREFQSAATPRATLATA